MLHLGHIEGKDIRDSTNLVLELDFNFVLNCVIFDILISCPADQGFLRYKVRVFSFYGNGIRIDLDTFCQR